MVAMTLRLSEDLAKKLRARVGPRGINRIAVELLAAWVEDGAADAEVAAKIGQKAHAKKVKAEDPPALEGYFCNYEHRGVRCNKPATYFLGGRMARCAEH